MVDWFLAWAPELVPTLLTLSIGGLVLGLSYRLLFVGRGSLRGEARFPRQAILFGLGILYFLALLISLPVEESTRERILGLVGLAFTAIIALSSTTLVANAMAGVMQRSVGSFKPGDFLRVGQHFGRVTERGLFHTEIQTEDRDLTTLPNAYLVTHPVTVVRSSGTIISCSLSLGYEVSSADVEEILLKSAGATGLEDPFVQVLNLNDFHVEYRIAGFLEEVKQLITKRSELRKRVLNEFHAAGIEIVSPAFMNQRQLKPDERMIPDRFEVTERADALPQQKTAEDIAFDKAEAAAELESLREVEESLSEKLEEMKREKNELSGDLRKEAERRLRLQEAQLSAVKHAIRSRQDLAKDS